MTFKVDGLVTWVGDDHPRIKKGLVGSVERIDDERQELVVDFGYTDMPLIRSAVRNFVAHGDVA